MKILVVSSYLPYPLYSGGYIRLYNLLKNLKEEHEITLICEKRDSESQKDIDEVAKICKKVITVDRKKALTPLNLLKSLVSLDPILLTVHTKPEMKKLIAKELSDGNYDLIHVETFYVMQNLPKVNIPVVLTEHNIEYLVYKRYMDKSPIFMKPALLLDIAKLKRKEREFWKKADQLIAVSPQEQKIMGGNCVVIPNGVDIKKFKPKEIDKDKKEKRILFIGDFRWIQNRNSAIYILKSIWPKIISQNKNKLDLKLWIVGRKIPDSIKSLESSDIVMDENAPKETQEIFEKADLLLAPIRVGGGTSFKILEALASGTPVITTTLGNEGINAKDGSEIVVCDKPEDYAAKSLEILSDNYLYEKLSRNGRIFIEEKYDWENIAKKLSSVYKKLAK